MLAASKFDANIQLLISLMMNRSLLKYFYFETLPWAYIKTLSVRKFKDFLNCNRSRFLWSCNLVLIAQINYSAIAATLQLRYNCKKKFNGSVLTGNRNYYIYGIENDRDDASGSVAY